MRPSTSLLFLLAALPLTGCGEPTGPDEPTLERRWQHPARLVDGVRARPQTTGDSLVVFASGQTLSAVRLADGAHAWTTETFEILGDIGSRDILIDGGTVYVGQGFRAHAFDLRTGARRWRFVPPDGRKFYSPGFYAVDARFFYGGGQQRLYVLDKRTGALVHEWAFESSARGVTLHEGYLYVGQSWDDPDLPGQNRGAILKLDPQTGEIVWRYETDRGGFHYVRPHVEDGVVYAATGEGSGVYVAVDAETGQERWRTEDEPTFWMDVEPGPQGRIYINDGLYYRAIDKQTGEVLWATKLGEGNWLGPIAYHDGYVYAGRYEALFVLDAATGEVVLAAPSPDGSIVWTVGAGGGLVFAQTTNSLTAFRPLQP